MAWNDRRLSIKTLPKATREEDGQGQGEDCSEPIRIVLMLPGIDQVPLELNEFGILPVAVHDAELAEIGAVFGEFQKTNRRVTLYTKLVQYVEELRKAGIRGSLIVDGSFVMSCIDEPDDIDVVLVLSEDWDMTANLRPFQYNLISKRDVKRNFPIEVYPVVAGADSEKKWTEFFQQINVKWYEPHGFANGAKKGLVRVSL